MKSLYAHIKELEINGNVKELFAELKLLEGYDLLLEIEAEEKDLPLILKYTACCYDSESPLHGVFPIRSELKKSVVKDFKISKTGVWGEIINGENAKFNEFIRWYWLQINDYYFKAIISCEEVIEMQLDTARMKITKGGELSVTESGVDSEPKKFDDDKYLKAVNLQNTCLTNAIDNISRLDDLKNTRLKKFERSDNAVAEEVFRNSGLGERGALLAKELRNKMNK